MELIHHAFSGNFVEKMYFETPPEELTLEIIEDSYNKALRNKERVTSIKPEVTYYRPLPLWQDLIIEFELYKKHRAFALGYALGGIGSFIIFTFLWIVTWIASKI